MSSRQRIESIMSNLEELYIKARNSGDNVLAQKLKYASEFILYSVFDDEYTAAAMKPIEFDILHQDQGIFVFGTPTGYVLPIETQKPILSHGNSNSMMFPVYKTNPANPYTSIWEKWVPPQEMKFEIYEVKLNQYRFQFNGKITTIKIGFDPHNGKWILAKGEL